MNMLNQREADDIRDGVLEFRAEKNLDTFDTDCYAIKQHVTEYGNIEVIHATGRATCRSCGEKIKKGEKAIRFCYDFTGCGSWTAQLVQVHLYTCLKTLTEKAGA